MNKSIWLRWRQPLIIFVLCFAGLGLIQNFIKSTLFQIDLSNRANIPLDTTDSAAVLRSLGISNLIPQLTFTCSPHDISELRMADQDSTHVHYLQLKTPKNECSVYGYVAPIDPASIINKSIKINDISISPYTNNRLIIVKHFSNGASLLAVSEPFTKLLYHSKTKRENIAITLTYKNQHITISNVNKKTTKHRLFKKDLPHNFSIEVFVTEQGINDVTKKDLYLINSVSMFALIVLCLLLGLNNNHQNSVKSMIDNGIRNKEFIPYYQPIINSITKKIVGCETLIRWHKSNGEIIPPNAFIDIAEKNKQIYEITRVRS
ncbi:EAL domain-containing protein [Photobacterium leiognathi]|uniref:EAL domain-containing protein n=1 Tax=Photobacterium leiognathi TaxID=553611 RepID=UPI00273A063F|nr:EAL domain-containing protein [Photobacterium leiognathi]